MNNDPARIIARWILVDSESAAPSFIRAHALGILMASAPDPTGVFSESQRQTILRLAADSRIAAIKEIRSILGCRLAEAVALLEKLK